MRWQRGLRARGLRRTTRGGATPSRPGFSVRQESPRAGEGPRATGLLPQGLIVHVSPPPGQVMERVLGVTWVLVLTVKMQLVPSLVS
jgi:hypothetical protein